MCSVHMEQQQKKRETALVPVPFYWTLPFLSKPQGAARVTSYMLVQEKVLYLYVLTDRCDSV